MRTTIEIGTDLRARLLAFAARRGERGFSRIVQEALERYLASDGESDRARRVARALATLGTMSDKSARHMRDTASRLRRTWRT